MIHRESQQLFIRPYAIDAEGKVRTIPYKVMSGHHTANARHLTHPAGRIYYATMEEGLYSVDVNTLEVEAGKKVSHDFPAAFSTYWVRAVSDTDTTATTWFTYE